MTEDLDRQLAALIDCISRHDGTPERRRAAESALRELYEAAGGRCFAVALRVLGRREWAEEVLQETFLQVWRNAGDYRAALSPPLAWLGVIARSRALDFLRRRATERADDMQELDERIEQTVPGNATDPADAWQASEHAVALHQCLGRLEAKQREVVSLAYFRDLSHSELAAQLKLPLGTVKTWVRRALDQLRACMARFA